VKRSGQLGGLAAIAVAVAFALKLVLFGSSYDVASAVPDTWTATAIFGAVVVAILAALAALVRWVDAGQEEVPVRPRSRHYASRHRRRQRVGRRDQHRRRHRR
jgi:hypothetical protein